MAMVVNLFHIKSTNGLYYYALDYLKEGRDRVEKVLVRPALLSHIRNELPENKLIACTWALFLREISLALLNRSRIYTPTPHPIPFVSNQFIVFHDSFPFKFGRYALLKSWLFKYSLRSSSCKVLHINKSDCVTFLEELGIQGERLLYAPNKILSGCRPNRKPRAQSRFPSLGLIGTASEKKSYDLLFSAIEKVGAQDNFEFRVLGHDNSYFRSLKSRFPSMRLLLVDSDAVSIPEFLEQVDLVISVSQGEGFGRPIAAALQTGVPCFALDCPVFREFYDPGATLFSDVASMLELLLKCDPAGLPRVIYAPPVSVREGYSTCVDQLFIDSRWG